MTSSLNLPDKWADGVVDVDIIGAGGTGSQLADQLASMEATLRELGHPGFKVTLHDGDTVSASNIGRQRFTSHDIGVSKSVVLAHRINAFYGLCWQASPSNVVIGKTRLNSTIGGGLVITCVDKAQFRAEFAQHYSKNTTGALWLDLGNGDHQAQCVIGHLGQPDGLGKVPNIFDLFPELASLTAQDRELPSCSAEQAIARQPWPINRLVAIIAMEIVWNLFRTGSVDTHGHFLEIAPFKTTPLPTDPIHWAMLGYTRKKKHRRKTRAAHQ